MRPSRRTAAAAAAALALLLAAGGAACSSVDVPESLPGPTTTTTEAGADQPAPDCGNPLASRRPTGPATADVPAGSYMAEIRERGRLRVGVDTGTYLFSSVNPRNGEFEGFDVDIARQVALALFGEGAEDRVQFVGLPSSERIPALVDGEVDLVASTFTINCERREEIEFSAEYFTAGQTVLVRGDLDADTVADLAGDEVCASEGSTAIDNIAALPEGPEVETAPQRADCLVRLQQGGIEGMATDDAILAGMAAQDPSLELIGGADNQERFSTENYGLGLPPGHPEWVRYVNAVLEDVRSSGTWSRLYQQNQLVEHLGAKQPPAPVYGD